MIKIGYIIRESDRSSTKCPFGIILGQIKGDCKSIDKWLHRKTNRKKSVHVGSWVCKLCSYFSGYGKEGKFVLCNHNPQLALFEL